MCFRHWRTSARKCGRPCCCCGCGLRRSPDAGVTREVARGSRDARAAMGVRARLGAAPPRAARNWGLVRPLLPAWPGAPAVVFLAFFTRPTGGIAGELPFESPSGHPRHHTTSPGTEARPRGHPPVTQPPHPTSSFWISPQGNFPRVVSWISLGLVDLSRTPSGTFFWEVRPGSEMATF